MLAPLLLLFNSFHAPLSPQPGPESIQLTVARSNPYLGEWLEFTLTIRTADYKTIRELRIPWLTPREAWNLRWQWWLHAFSPDAACLLVRFHDILTVARCIRPGEYQIHGRLLAQPSSDETDVRVLSSVQWGSLSSQPVTLHFQQPPPLSISGSSWNLGIGTYRIVAEWSRSDVVLGEETTLILKVAGPAVETLTAPPLRSLPGWEGDRFLIEAGPDQWKQGERCFTFQIRPRQLRAAIPPLIVTSFDPQRGMQVTQQITIPPWQVLAARDPHTPLPGSSAQDALNHLPEFRRYSLQQHEPFPWAEWANWLLLLPALTLLAILFKQIIIWSLPEWVESLRWKRATRLLTYQLQYQQYSVPQLRTSLAAYFSAGLARTVCSDWEALCMIAARSPQADRIQSLCEQFRYREFAPVGQDDALLLQQKLLQLFQQEHS